MDNFSDYDPYGSPRQEIEMLQKIEVPQEIVVEQTENADVTVIQVQDDPTENSNGYSQDNYVSLEPKLSPVQAILAQPRPPSGPPAQALDEEAMIAQFHKQFKTGCCSRFWNVFYNNCELSFCTFFIYLALILTFVVFLNLDPEGENLFHIAFWIGLFATGLLVLGYFFCFIVSAKFICCYQRMMRSQKQLLFNDDRVAGQFVNDWVCVWYLA